MDPANRAPSPRAPDRARARIPWRSLTTRILAINMLALVILAIGLLYLDKQQRDLFEAKIEALTIEGELVAGALGGSVVRGEEAGAPLAFDIEAARQMIGRLVAPTGTRARLYDAAGEILVDSRLLAGAVPLVETEELPEPSRPNAIARVVERLYRWIIDRLPPRADLPPYHEAAGDHAEFHRALAGESGSLIEDAGADGLVVTVAVPVQHFKQIQGVLLLTASADDIERKVREARFGILNAFAIALGVTVLLSLYFAATIARPVRRLARAADRVRAGSGRKVQIPDFTRRRDEIGELSSALRAMTDALWQRIDAIERFAADVAHEIKNPLSSVRSAIEALERVDDADQRDRLMAIVLDDVRRLDRLISDISDASRLDAELSRAEIAPVDLRRLLQALVEVDAATRDEAGAKPAPVLELRPAAGDCVVPGMEDRLVQVLRNLIANARSFSPPGGRITLSVEPDALEVRVVVEDEGPGLPAGGFERIFERFYSLRPAGEKFGTHSGLGLSISKQIVEAHGGLIVAENRLDSAGRPIGARFVVHLPR